MQMYLRETRSIKKADALILPMENAALSPVDVDDIAKVSVALLTSKDDHTGKSYDMTGPEALTMTKVAEEISTVLGRTIRYMNMAPEAYKELLISNNVPGDLVEVLDEIFAERRKWVGSKVNLTTHALFGVRPTTFREFVQKNITAFE
jgi:uncharacterized protein YbjT (DUF2867 family)